VLTGLTERRELALGPEVWRQLMPTTGTTGLLDGLMDIVSDIPALLEAAEPVITDTAVCSPAEVSALAKSLIDAYKRLDAWQQFCQLSSPTPLYWAIPSTLHNPSDDLFPSKLYPFALEFQTLAIAVISILGAGVILQILGTIIRLDAKTCYQEDLLSTHDLGEPQILGLHTGQEMFLDSFELSTRSYNSVPLLKKEADRLARFICQSIEYCHRLEMGTFGAQVTCHSQWSARRYFRQTQQNRELSWCQNIKNMRGPGSRCGIDMMIFGDEDPLP